MQLRLIELRKQRADEKRSFCLTEKDVRYSTDSLRARDGKQLGEHAAYLIEHNWQHAQVEQDGAQATEEDCYRQHAECPDASRGAAKNKVRPEVGMRKQR